MTMTTAQIRNGYASVAYTDAGVDLRLNDFDDWLAAHDAEITKAAYHRIVNALDPWEES